MHEHWNSDEHHAQNRPEDDKVVDDSSALSNSNEKPAQARPNPAEHGEDIASQGNPCSEEHHGHLEASSKAESRRRNVKEFGDIVRFTPWRDVNIESLGYDPRSSYVENFWLPFLGPSTVFLLRRVVESLETQPYGFSVGINELSAMLGLGSSTSARRSSVQKTLNRILIFEIGRLMPSEAISVRLKMPPLPQRYVDRLPPTLCERHAASVDQGSSTPLAAIRARARSLALALSKLGHDRLAIESQLLAWRIHPSICYETLQWVDDTLPPKKDPNPKPEAS